MERIFNHANKEKQAEYTANIRTSLISKCEIVTEKHALEAKQKGTTGLSPYLFWVVMDGGQAIWELLAYK